MSTSLFIRIGEGKEDADSSGGAEGTNNSDSEGDKENAIAADEFSNRKQKKSRHRKEDGLSACKNTGRKGKRWSGSGSRRGGSKPKVSEGDLSALLRNYVLTPEEMICLGYPFESRLHPGRAVVYKSGDPRRTLEPRRMPRSTHLFDANAGEFVPHYGSPQMSKVSGSEITPDGGGPSFSDEGSDVGGSEAGRRTSDPDSTTDEETCPTEKAIDEKRCVRCGRPFFIMLDGEYLTREMCRYHWGKLLRIFRCAPREAPSAVSEYSCCGGKRNSEGCTTAKLHVWNGMSTGVNGPLDGYVKTRQGGCSPNGGDYGVYSVDCEMCYTKQGLELTKVTVVNAHGRTVYDSFVKPDNTIIDYNTRFSGITAKDLRKRSAAKCLQQVQKELTDFIYSDTILIGHGLENDLKALKMIHSAVIDTSVLFPHHYGLPYRRSLRSLVNTFLKRDIQSHCHDSVEDARACMELTLWRVRKDFNNLFDGYPLVENV